MTPATMALAVTSLMVAGIIALTLYLGGQAKLPQAIATATRLASGDTLQPTSVLGGTQPPIQWPVTHIVQPGETLISIAYQYGIPPEILQAVNHIENPHAIPVGQALTIPDPASFQPVTPIVSPTPLPTATLTLDNPLNLSLNSGWPRSITDGTDEEIAANYPVMVVRPRFRLHYQPGTYPELYLNEAVALVESALDKVETRLNVRLDQTFDAYAAGTLFTGDESDLRGRARSKELRLFFLFDGTGGAADNAYVVVHELTHLVAWNTWGTPSSTMLSEGLATYVGKYELESGGFLPYDQLCLGIYAAGQMSSMAEIDREPKQFQGHLEHRFNYFGSACFVDYLVNNYGLEPLSRLYHTSDYTNLYGKSLPELDAEWRATLQARKGELVLDPIALVDYTHEVTIAYNYVFHNYNGTVTFHEAYLAMDQARVALWQGNYPETRRWLDEVYSITGYKP